MLHYAEDNLSKDGKFGVKIADADLAFQKIAVSQRFIATEEKQESLWWDHGISERGCVELIKWC